MYNDIKSTFDLEEFNSFISAVKKQSFIALPGIELKVERIGYSDDELRAKAKELRDCLFDTDIDFYSDKIYSFLKEMWSNVQHTQK